VSRVGEPGKAPTTTSALQYKSITPIELAVGQWHFRFAVDAEPASGVLRDLATTMAAVAGVSRDCALRAVLAAIASPPVVWEAAA
jgi:hypothetical protein